VCEHEVNPSTNDKSYYRKKKLKPKMIKLLQNKAILRWSVHYFWLTEILLK